MNGVKRVTVRRSAKEWRAIVSRFERSGQTSRQFCSAEQLAPSTFALWRRRLRGSAAGSESNGAARFVALADSPPASAAWEAELDLGYGVVLRLRRPSRC